MLRRRTGRVLVWMSSPPAVLLGRQEPRVTLEPKRSPRFDDGGDACFLASRYGLTPDPWQAMVVVSWLGRSSSNRLAAGRCGLAVPRQNGKNGIPVSYTHLRAHET